MDAFFPNLHPYESKDIECIKSILTKIVSHFKLEKSNGLSFDLNDESTLFLNILAFNPMQEMDVSYSRLISHIFSSLQALKTIVLSGGIEKEAFSISVEISRERWNNRIRLRLRHFPFCTE